MSPLTVDASLLARLNNLDRPYEFRDESGRVLGYFLPLGSNGAAIRSPCPREELDRRRQQRTGRPLAEILKELGAT